MRESAGIKGIKFNTLLVADHGMTNVHQVIHLGPKIVGNFSFFNTRGPFSLGSRTFNNNYEVPLPLQLNCCTIYDQDSIPQRILNEKYNIKQYGNVMILCEPGCIFDVKKDLDEGVLFKIEEVPEGKIGTHGYFSDDSIDMLGLIAFNGPQNAKINYSTTFRFDSPLFLDFFSNNTSIDYIIHNVDLYSVLCTYILGINPAPNNGSKEGFKTIKKLINW